MPAERPRPRVVLIEDDSDYRLVLENMLSKDFEVVALESGDGFLEELDSVRPDLVILDVMLPGADGFELCKQVRSSSSFGSLPVLFVTSCDADRDFVANVEAGGSAYLTKPVSRRVLLSKVRELLPAAA